MSEPYQIGMVGLGVMGANLLRNFANNGISGVGISRSVATVDSFAHRYANSNNLLDTAKDYNSLLKKLSRPRKIFVLVPAGQATEAVLEDLSQRLDKDDVIIECGNSFYVDTNNREQRMISKGLRFIGCGVSGGEEGALKGPSLMPGGDKTAYQELAPLLECIAAVGSHGACVEYMGPGGAGHYVKMVHNGIEYADMQLIAEICDVLIDTQGPARLADTFEDWNKGQLESFLVEITARVLRQPDNCDKDRLLVEMIKDIAPMKGTGIWTVKDALARGACVPTIAAAVDSRLMSAQFDLRQRASQLLNAKTVRKTADETDVITDDTLIKQAQEALFCSKVCCYAQGMSLLHMASKEFGWKLPLSKIAGIWTAGCIIRARLLDSIQHAFSQQPQLENLLMDAYFYKEVKKRQPPWRNFVAVALQKGNPLAAIFSALSYYDALHAKRLPAYIIQAQRDLFGAHTYQRLDKTGNFHTKWNN